MWQCFDLKLLNYMSPEDAITAWETFQRQSIPLSDLSGRVTVEILSVCTNVVTVTN